MVAYLLEKEWTYYLRPQDPSDNFVSWEGSEDTPFTKATRDELVWSPASLISSMVTFGRLKLRVGKATELG